MAGVADTLDGIADTDLVRLAADGELSAFDVLMRRYNQRLYRTARSILRDETEAEDAVQEAWWKAFRHLNEFRGESEAATWLTRIVANEALMQLRRNKRRDAVIKFADADQMEPDTMPQPEMPTPERLAWRQELRLRLEQQIDALPAHYRAVFMLRGVEEMTSAEAALVLGIPETTVRVRFMRARRLLQRALQRDMDGSARDAFSFAGERCDRIIAGVHARMRAAGVL